MLKQITKPIALLLLVCSALSAYCQAGSKTGITVIVKELGHAGPTRLNDPPHYFRGPLLVKRVADGQIVARGVADSKGLYTFEVPPGTYIVTDAGQPGYRRQVHSNEIVVVQGQFTAVQLSHDNGMR